MKKIISILAAALLAASLFAVSYKNNTFQKLADEYTKKAEELGKFYSNMDADKAAARLSEMSEDLDLIKDILENMSEKQAAAILQEMDVDFAAQITKKISAVKE